MGTEEQRMRTAIFVVALALAVTGIWAVTEVQELGNDDSNSGSSVSLDADDSAEYDDADMGEGVGFNRASFLTTSGSFTLSSGSRLQPCLLSHYQGFFHTVLGEQQCSWHWWRGRRVRLLGQKALQSSKVMPSIYMSNSARISLCCLCS